MSFPLHGWPLPPPLETAHLLGKGLPSGAPPVPLRDELYALGWSRSNELAFLERRTSAQGTVVRFQILDLVDDRVVFEEIWPDWGSEADQPGWWSAKQARVDELFKSYSIEPTNWQMGVFPLILDNEYYSIAFRSYPSGEDPRWIERFELVVNSTGRGLKTVKDVTGYWRWGTVLGFLPSPFENRIAVVLLVQPAGWSGDQQPLRFLVVGLSLKAGFPKP